MSRGLRIAALVGCGHTQEHPNRVSDARPLQRDINPVAATINVGSDTSGNVWVKKNDRNAATAAPSSAPEPLDGGPTTPAPNASQDPFASP